MANYKDAGRQGVGVRHIGLPFWGQLMWEVSLRGEETPPGCSLGEVVVSAYTAAGGRECNAASSQQQSDRRDTSPFKKKILYFRSMQSSPAKSTPLHVMGVDKNKMGGGCDNGYLGGDISFTRSVTHIYRKELFHRVSFSGTGYFKAMCAALSPLGFLGS